VESQRGFTLVETLVAAFVAVVLGWTLLWIAHASVFAAVHLDGRLNAAASVDRLTERLSSDAASAWSVFVPSDDVSGESNADGHELDFAAEDAAHQSHWWAYSFDAATASVTIYAYAAGTPPVAGDRFDGISGFAAETHEIGDVADPASDVYDPLFAGEIITPVDFPFPWNAQAVGGNHLVRVQAAGSGVARTLLLSSATAPSHFTLVVDYTPPPSTPAP